MSSSRGPNGHGRQPSQQSNEYASQSAHRAQLSSSSVSSVPSPPPRTAHNRLLPNPRIHGPSKLARLQAYFQRFMSDELKVTDGEVAKTFLRAVLRQTGEPDVTEQCISDFAATGTGLFNLTDALSHNLDDIEFLNNFIGQFFIFIGHKYGTKDKALNVINFDDKVRLIMKRVVLDCSDTLQAMARAAKRDKLTPEALEGFAWFLQEYVEFSNKIPQYIEEIIHDQAVLEKFYDEVTAPQQLRLIGHKLKYWRDCNAVPNRRSIKGYVPGGRHDNDFESYREINIVPTPDEIHSKALPFLVKPRDVSRLEGDARVGSHLDCHFRLLREEMLNEVRADYHDFINNQIAGFTPNHHSERSRVIFEDLRWGGWDFECCIKHRKFGIRLNLTEPGFAKTLKYPPGSYNKLLSEDPNFPYKNNSLACLVVDGEIAGFGHLNKDPECLRETPPCIILTFDGMKAIQFLMTKLWLAVVKQPEDAAQIKLICVDTPVFAHEPILHRLQAMREIPLAKELIHFRRGDAIAKTSFYPEQPARHISPDKPLKDIVKGGTMMTMDKAQCKAITTALQHKVALIQGPPGTGKTLIGNILAKLFYLYTSEKMLVITQQNHICDEFLENIMGMGIRQEHIVRLGSQYTRITRSVSLNEISDEKDIFTAAKETIDLLENNLQCAWLPIEEVYAETFGNSMLMQDIHAVAVLYNEPNPWDPEDPFGYRAAFTVPDGWIELLLAADENVKPPTNSQIFHLWAENEAPPPMMLEQMPEKGRLIWDLPAEDRHTLMTWWREATMRDQIFGIAENAMIYNKIVDELQSWKDTRIRNVLNEKRIIAATTNGAAKHLNSIAEVAPKIIIVEEAASIFESHVLAALHPNVEQLILIGDHQQLRPRCDTFELQRDSKKGYDLDISLFERLVKANFPFTRLETQHRARPEIANIIRSIFYPELKDATHVSRFPRMRGFQFNMFWAHHEHPESTASEFSGRASSIFKKSSKINEFEANMVVSILRYLGANGYNSDQMAVVTPYLGQVGLISKLIREKSKFDVLLSQMDYHELVRAGLMEARDAAGITKYVEVCTVDQFQGSDRDIVILSMVRSNRERNMGFLRNPERVNVMFSRARKGLIVLGNMHTAVGKKHPDGPTIWGRVLDVFLKEDRVFPGVPIICSKHSQQKFICETPEDLIYQAPEGRCRLPCGVMLPCKKHTCSYFCHNGDDHKSTICEVMVKRSCMKGHQWQDYCWSPRLKPCEKCERIDAHFQAINNEEDAQREAEHNQDIAQEKARKEVAEKEKLESQRKKALDKVTNERLIAEGKLEPVTPKRTRPYVRPFGQNEFQKKMEEDAATAKRQQDEVEAAVKEAKKLTSPQNSNGITPHRIKKTAPHQTSSSSDSPRPLAVEDLQNRHKGPSTGKKVDSSSLEGFNTSSPVQSPDKPKPPPNTPLDTTILTSAADHAISGSISAPLDITSGTPCDDLSDAGSTIESNGTALKDDEITDSASIEIYVEDGSPVEPRIVNDDDISSEVFEEFPSVTGIQAKFNTQSMSPLLPSSPPVRLTQSTMLDEGPELPPTLIKDEVVAELVVVEDGSEPLIRDIPLAVPDISTIIEDPHSFIHDDPSQFEKMRTNVVDDVLSADITSISIPAIDVTPPRSTPSKAPSSSDTPRNLGPKSKMFPSASRDEWNRQKLHSNDSNIALDQIMDMIGMEHVKEQVLAIKAKAETVHRQGVDLRDERFHIALLGNPGTGKTSFARLYAKFLRSEGLLESTLYIETNGAKLASDGIAGIEDTFRALFEVKGGTLFIDEAYQLVTSGAFEGRRVLDYLLSEMEKHLGKIVIVISGYNKEMEKFFEHNPGLNSRIPYRVQFEDFTNEELLYLLQDVLKRKFRDRMTIEGGFDGLYMRIVSKRLGRTRGMAGCGNARGVQNTVAKMLERQAARLAKARKDDLPTDDFYLTKEDIIGPAPTKAAMDSPAWKELHQLIGLSAVKESVLVLLKRMEKNYKRELDEERPIDISLNRVFLGSPGTGKTSVAKIYGKILAQLGLLSSGEVIMKTPSDFIGRALGDSEANTKAILNAARGKVLIIDEAYMLMPKLNGAEDPYKAAVIDTIVSEVQNVPGDDQCVLLLGYKEDLQKMFNGVNPGFSRRFPIDDGFVFEDFTDIELSDILNLKLRLAEIDASQEARDAAIAKISQKRQKPNFGNAGEVENLLNVAKERMLKRQIDGEDMASELLATDFDRDHDRGNCANTDLQDLFKDLIGVNDVMQRFEDYQTTTMIMRGRGIDPQQHIPMLFIFKGPPGTGKTTTARKMGQIFYNMGFLASNEVVECSASDLTAEYLGQTAQKTRKKLESALGKVLFIDEAYRLQDNQYGTEASNELVDAVTKPQYMGKLVVILAGYDEGMNRLLAVNVGLASRFSEVIDFPDVDYITATEILKAEVGKAQATIPSLNDPNSENYRDLLKHMEETTKSPGWGHARDALNLSKSMVAAAFRGVKNLKDPIIITHEMALKTIMDMLRQRRGRTFQMPEETIKSLGLSTVQVPPITPRVEYQQPAPAPKVDYNFNTEDIYKAQEASAHGGSTSNGNTIFSHRVQDEDEIPRLSQDINEREPGTTDNDWVSLLQSREDAEARHNVECQRRLKLRRDLNNYQRHFKHASSKITELEVKMDEDNALRKNLVFLHELNDAYEEEQEVRNMIEQSETLLVGLVENEKLAAAKEKVNLVKLEKLGLCPKKYHWIKMPGGYRCGGGEHHISNEELAEYQMPL
ncbi:hypothetical protein H072_11585 [Dactylellina haptotyla CBS 200.50]|uniref:AAA+ ATPase domain-containing protein n=1 Tax=Dactylellina haptotyla (strain CBS 200.50) TaxID=1284197 RepID=S8BIQ7_DACHA|nr:hypothetical protein H072_11585 [Dactylellina haptotyla CBS 200.50]